MHPDAWHDIRDFAVDDCPPGNCIYEDVNMKSAILTGHKRIRKFAIIMTFCRHLLLLLLLGVSFLLRLGSGCFLLNPQRQRYLLYRIIAVMLRLYARHYKQKCNNSRSVSVVGGTRLFLIAIYRNCFYCSIMLDWDVSFSLNCNCEEGLRRKSVRMGNILKEL